MRGAAMPPLSETPHQVGRVPTALLFAIAALIAVEMAVRSIEPRAIIPYEETGHSAYSAIRHFVEEYGPAEVAFLGSSRGREAIVCPEMRRLCEEALGRAVTVANYACPAGGSDEMEAVARLLLNGDRKPALIMYGMSPLQLSALAAETRHAGELWSLADLRRERESLGRMFENIRDEVIQNEIDRFYKTFAYRRSAWILLKELVGPSQRQSCPIGGELTQHQSADPDTSLVTRPVTNARVREYLARRMVGNRMPLGGDAEKHLDTLMALCMEAGVPLILYEVPLSRILLDNYPTGVMPQYRRIVQALCRRHGVPFIRIEQIPATFTDADFREQSHLNYHGAMKLTPLVAERIVIPALRGQ